METPLPDWLTYKTSYDAAAGTATVTFTAKVLPDDELERFASVTFGSDGDVLTFNINQSLFNSIAEDEVTSKVQIAYKDDSFALSYPLEYTSVRMYTISGQLAGHFDLPNDGIFSIPAGDLVKGVYLLEFSGSSAGETVKAVK